MALGACGSTAGGDQSGTPTVAPTTTATTVSGGAVVHYQLTATGTSSLSKQVTVSADPCPQFVGANHATGANRFDQLFVSATDGFTLNLDVIPYNGPGTYTSSTAEMEFDVAAAAYQRSFSGGSSQPYFTLVTRPDGSGSFSFNGWADVNDQSKTESAMLTWTCRNG